MRVRIHNTKKEIKQWAKESVKVSRNIDSSLSQTLRFSIRWENANAETSGEKYPFNKHEYEFLSMLKECVRSANHALSNGEQIKGSAAVLKIPTHSAKRKNGVLDEDFEVVVGFNDLLWYAPYSSSVDLQKKKRNTHIGQLRNLQTLILTLIELTETKEEQPQ